jgi:hypothetical protein
MGMRGRPQSGEAYCYERRQVSLDVNTWTDLDIAAKARGQSTPRMLRQLIEVIVHDGLIDAIIDDGHERNPPRPPRPAPASLASLAPRLIGSLG